MKIYFCVAAILSVIVLVQSETTEPDWNAQLEECRKEFELSEEAIKSPDFNDSKTRCLSACFLKKGNRLTDGKVSVDKEVEIALKYKPEQFDSDSVKEMATECANKANEETEECAVGGTLFKCMIEKFGSPSS